MAGDFELYLSDIIQKKNYKSTVATLKQKEKTLKNMGKVNLFAIEECTKIQQEYEQTYKHWEDVSKSVEGLRTFIQELNDQCIVRFQQTYEHVNRNFKEIYPSLVGGGQSFLELERPDDLLSTGVCIFARPPGKRLQQLSLMSGGEKAMVAISLLFSLFKEKPSPFCLLDEVDAPLDEGNGARFNMMLRDMAKDSQFIVITHNKKTMEAMDILYGVSMPKPGVSQLGTVRLN